jgi:hypothetical protein
MKNKTFYVIMMLESKWDPLSDNIVIKFIVEGELS